MKFKGAIIAISCLLFMSTVAIAQNGKSVSPTKNQTTDQAILQLGKPKNWVNDNEKIFTEAQIKNLSTLIRNFEARTGIEIAIATIPSTLVNTAQFDSFTLAIANSWGVGKKGKDNGILIGLSRSLRKIRINNGYGIEKLITDQETKQLISDYFISNFKEGNYYEGTLQGLTALQKLLDTKIKKRH